MDQDRKNAQAWAQEWAIKQKRKKVAALVIAVIAIVAIFFFIKYFVIYMSRMTFDSAAEMKTQLQGRYVYEKGYEDIIIDGDTVTINYYNRSHYDADYAKEYGYSSYEDNTYEETVDEWNYREGYIKAGWMDDITVNSNGDLIYYDQVYTKTDEPVPTPIDPSDLYSSDDSSSEISEEEAQEMEEETQAAEESKELTEQAASEAGETAEAGTTAQTNKTAETPEAATTDETTE